MPPPPPLRVWYDCSFVCLDVRLFVFLFVLFVVLCSVSMAVCFGLYGCLFVVFLVSCFCLFVCQLGRCARPFAWFVRYQAPGSCFVFACLLVRYLYVRGTIVKRTYGTNKKLYISLFFPTRFGPINHGPP